MHRSNGTIQKRNVAATGHFPVFFRASIDSEQGGRFESRRRLVGNCHQQRSVCDRQFGPTQSQKETIANLNKIGIQFEFPKENLVIVRQYEVLCNQLFSNKQLYTFGKRTI